MKNLIENWANDCQKTINFNKYESRHIDDLLGKDLEKKEFLPLSKQALLILTDYVVDKELKLIPSLVIPLQSLDSKILFAVPKNIEELANDVNELEPPSLYLLTEDVLIKSYFQRCEEYKAPIEFDIFESSRHNFHIYYRESRCEEEFTNHWEFARSIYIDYMGKV